MKLSWRDHLAIVGSAIVFILLGVAFLFPDPFVYRPAKRLADRSAAVPADASCQLTARAAAVLPGVTLRPATH